MKGTALFVLCIIATSLSDAHGRKRPQFDVFEIRENQRTKKLQVEPVKLQYDLESREKEAEYQTMINRLLKPLKKKRAKDFAGDIVKRLQSLKEQESSRAAKKRARTKKGKSPIVLLVSPDYLDGLGSREYRDTKSQHQLTLGSNVEFNIVPPGPVKKVSNTRKLRLSSILRNGQSGVDDRTDAPRSGHRVYYEDMDQDED